MKKFGDHDVTSLRLLVDKDRAAMRTPLIWWSTQVGRVVVRVLSTINEKVEARLDAVDGSDHGSSRECSGGSFSNGFLGHIRPCSSIQTKGARKWKEVSATS